MGSISHHTAGQYCARPVSTSHWCQDQHDSILSCVAMKRLCRIAPLARSQRSMELVSLGQS